MQYPTHLVVNFNRNHDSSLAGAQSMERHLPPHACVSCPTLSLLVSLILWYVCTWRHLLIYLLLFLQQSIWLHKGRCEIFPGILQACFYRTLDVCARVCVCVSHQQQSQMTQKSMVSKVREINRNTAAMATRITIASSLEIPNSVYARRQFQPVLTVVVET